MDFCNLCSSVRDLKPTSRASGKSSSCARYSTSSRALEPRSTSPLHLQSRPTHTRSTDRLWKHNMSVILYSPSFHSKPIWCYLSLKQKGELILFNQPNGNDYWQMSIVSKWLNKGQILKNIPYSYKEYFSIQAWPHLSRLLCFSEKQIHKSRYIVLEQND